MNKLWAAAEWGRHSELCPAAKSRSRNTEKNNKEQRVEDQ